MRIAVAALLLARAASAEPVGFAALPGGTHVADAATLPAGQLAVAALGGYGQREAAPVDNLYIPLHRAGGWIAASYGLLPALSVAATLEGHWDRIWGVGTLNGENGPLDLHHRDLRVDGRVTHALGDIDVALQLGLIMPAADVSVLSADLRAVGARTLGRLHLAAELGYRADNTARRAPFVAMPLRSQQALVMSLGISDFDAVFSGLRERIDYRQVWFSLEEVMIFFVRDPPPMHASLEDGNALVRLSISGGVRLGGGVSVFVWADRTLMQPGITGTQAVGVVPVVPYEPDLAAGVAVTMQFAASAL